jgi:ABC-type transporter Mla MlaB component
MSDLNLSYTVSNDGTTLTVTAAGKLAIDTATELHQLLLDQISIVRKIQLDLSGIHEIDLAGMQLICSACRTSLDDKKSFNFSGCMPATVKTAITAIGLQRQSACKHNADLPCIWCGGIN